jgi:hypothetical protein
LPDLAKVKRRGGDFDLGEASKAANRKPIIGGIVEHWIRHAEGRSTVAFGITREHSRHIVRAFNWAGIKAEHLDGEATPKERAAVLARSKAGVTKIVSCCDLSWNQIVPSLRLMQSKLIDLGFEYYNGNIVINETETEGSQYHA